MQEDSTKLADHIKSLKAEFAAYEAANTLVCVIQNWLDYMWGLEGICGEAMELFDRFPRIQDKWKPDFLVRFRNGYYLIGEIMRTFRPASEDVKQLIAYSRFDLGSGCHHDVLLIVRAENDDVACSAMASMSHRPNEEDRPVSPIVVLGYYRDNDAVNGEILLLKWRDQAGNSRFSPENVPADAGAADLNSEICDKPYCPLRINDRVVCLKDRYPFINDEPPPIYTAVWAIWPAIALLLNDEERDEMQMRGIVDKEVSTEDILLLPDSSDAGLSIGLINKAFSFLESVDLAKRVHKDSEMKYVVHFRQSPSKLSDMLDFFADKQARSRIRLEKRSKHSHGGRRRQRNSPEQTSLFDL